MQTVRWFTALFAQIAHRAESKRRKAVHEHHVQLRSDTDILNAADVSQVAGAS